MNRDYRARIARLNPMLNAYMDLTDEPVSDGLAWAIKSNIAVKGLPCTGGIGAYRDNIATEDAYVIKSIRRAGGQCILGTVNMHEGALGATTDNEAFGRTHNPWADGFTPGGSSGGSGAAVAAGLCDVALGTDTMGSIRIPASYCGVQGFKPTRGLLSIEGIMPLSETLDHVGPLARDVETLWKAMRVLAGWTDAFALQPFTGLRAGVWTGGGEVELDREISDGLLRAVEALRTHGVSIAPFAPPVYDYAVSRRAGLLISEVEGEAFHREMIARDENGFSQTFLRLLKWGAGQSKEKLHRAYEHIRAVEAAAQPIWKTFDFVIAPVAPQTAFAFANDVPASQADFTAWSNFAGLPAAAVCIGFSDAGLPFGAQIIGAKGDDKRVLQIAGALEALAGEPRLPPRCA